MNVLDVTAECFDILSSTILIFSLSFVITGIIVGLLQTVFSVQDQGLPITAKLIVFIILLTKVGGDVYDRFTLLLQNI
ncbi:flagellar biosynthetic protein FliQ [Vibrio cholerae]|uniref:flagellar biosynthetic protein FliQ n=1 Tax=Vibrio cholerae TaxID=666 RepID=UPI000E6CD322|nr:flagellar biosynthetic protein FliQ [Vibrio cholerae]MEB5517857.1 flagellar biosynthetic protein FliQ [Vibrio cholerae]NOE11451.1 flagellar biosynthetic protein FliQ [Vibrio cholerae]NOF33103.1 flagellar biosynthetic protein FliQ [Vibrio cholerae]RJK82845.1 type III secretion protein [Vibrio cholerae]GIB52613.1 Putative type III secretion apparatus protein [Vibrio cholerae]